MDEMVKKAVQTVTQEPERARMLQAAASDLFLRLEEECEIPLDDGQRAEFMKALVDKMVEGSVPTRWGFSGGCGNR